MPACLRDSGDGGRFSLLSSTGDVFKGLAICIYIRSFVYIYKYNIRSYTVCIYTVLVTPMYTRTCVHIHTQEQNHAQYVFRVGQNRIYAPYMTGYLVISLPKIPYIHHTCIYGSGQPYVYTHMRTHTHPGAEPHTTHAAAFTCRLGTTAGLEPLGTTWNHLKSLEPLGTTAGLKPHTTHAAAFTSRLGTTAGLKFFPHTTHAAAFTCRLGSADGGGRQAPARGVWAQVTAT